MIADLKPYAEYKESKIPWVPMLPKPWDTRRLRHVCEMRVSNVDKHTKAGETPVRLCNYVDVYKNERIREHIRFRSASATEDELVRFRLRKCDVVITKDSEDWNDIGVPSLVEYEAPDLVCGYHLAILRARPVIHGAFLHRALQCHLIGAQLHVEANGVTRYGLSHGAIQGASIPLPPLGEQAVIVRFLDWAVGRLTRAIRAKRKVIALLNEQKQAIIYRAVTRGLDPFVPLKPSGIAWLGHIPQHWELRKVRHLSRQVVDGTHFTPTYRDEGVAFIRVKDIHDNVIDQSKLRRISKEEHLQLNKRCNPEKGDLLLSKNGTIGLTTVVDWDFPFSIFVSLCLIKPIKSLVSADFISFAFAGGLLMRQLADNTKTTSVTNLHLDKIRGLMLPIPPLHEQLDIITKKGEEICQSPPSS